MRYALESLVSVTNRHTVARAWADRNPRSKKRSPSSKGINAKLLETSINQNQMFDVNHKLMEAFQERQFKSKGIIERINVKKEDFTKQSLTNYGIDHLYSSALIDPKLANEIKLALQEETDLPNDIVNAYKYRIIDPNHPPV